MQTELKRDLKIKDAPAEAGIRPGNSLSARIAPAAAAVTAGFPGVPLKPVAVAVHAAMIQGAPQAVEKRSQMWERILSPGHVIQARFDDLSAALSFAPAKVKIMMGVSVVLVALSFVGAFSVTPAINYLSAKMQESPAVTDAKAAVSPVTMKGIVDAALVPGEAPVIEAKDVPDMITETLKTLTDTGKLPTAHFVPWAKTRLASGGVSYATTKDGNTHFLGLLVKYAEPGAAESDHLWVGVAHKMRDGKWALWNVVPASQDKRLLAFRAVAQVNESQISNALADTFVGIK